MGRFKQRWQQKMDRELPPGYGIACISMDYPVWFGLIIAIGHKSFAATNFSPG
jgi:hypothetical protein